MKICPIHDTFLQRHAFILSDDPARLDIEFMLDVLATTYWSKSEPRELLRKAIAGSHPYGFYAPDGSPAGFLRVLSDGVYNARLSDLFILPEYRGRGLGRWVMATLLYASRFRDVRRWQLVTNDMHALYSRFGFETFEGNGQFMTLVREGETLKTGKGLST